MLKCSSGSWVINVRSQHLTFTVQAAASGENWGRSSRLREAPTELKHFWAIFKKKSSCYFLQKFFLEISYNQSKAGNLPGSDIEERIIACKGSSSTLKKGRVLFVLYHFLSHKHVYIYRKSYISHLLIGPLCSFEKFNLRIWVSTLLMKSSYTMFIFSVTEQTSCSPRKIRSHPGHCLKLERWQGPPL